MALALSVVAAATLLVGLIPFLGWLNWFTTLPLATAALVLSILGIVKESDQGLGVVGLLVSLGVLFVAAFRLLLEGGLL